MGLLVTDTHSWKHYLPVASLAGVKKRSLIELFTVDANLPGMLLKNQYLAKEKPSSGARSDDHWIKLLLLV